MNETAPRVIKIPAKPESVRQAELQRQLRGAAYCRVSTKEEDQANSYEVQKEYYTDKIMSNPVWTMAGIFADKGITGTSVKKREDFMRMIRHCRQKKIDVVLTKSVSRFARNTVDCLYYPGQYQIPYRRRWAARYSPMGHRQGNQADLCPCALQGQRMAQRAESPHGAGRDPRLQRKTAGAHRTGGQR